MSGPAGPASPGDYGATHGPQDGQPGPIQPIQVPPPTSAPPPAAQPPVVQPSPAQPPVGTPPSGWQSGASAVGRTNWLGGLTAASGTIAMLLFFICGFVFDGWGWSWLFFFLPALVGAFARGARN
ncbi:MAG: hypothetical protein V9G19_19965 [Tetrasphaera sp.]